MTNPSLYCKIKYSFYRETVMNYSFFKSLNKKNYIFFGGILCILFTLLFTSCDNFLKAEDIREEIEKVIDYNNAQKVPVLIRADEGTGSFLVEGEKEFTVNFTEAELQFTANTKAIVFKGLEAVSKTNHSISRNDCVAFTKISGNEDTGVYTYSLKITQKVNDILIKPVYQLRPAVVSISPLYTNLPTDSIVITFNIPVEDKNVKPENSVLNFENISIKCNNTDITNCFNTPTLNEDKTILTITPNSTAFNAFLHSKNSSPYTDISVSLDPRTIFEIDGNYLKYAEDNTLDFILHYSTDFEITPPEKQEFAIFKDWNTSTNSGSGMFFLKYNNFKQDDDNSAWECYWEDEVITDEEFAYHIAGEYVYICGKYNDVDSGIKTISVEEYYDGNLNSNVYKTAETSCIIKEYTKDSDEVIFWSRYSNGNIVFCIKKKLLSDDGIISVRTTVKDAFGNCAEQEEYTVIKSTSINLDDITLINCPTIKYSWDSDPIIFDMTEYLEELRDIKLIYVSPRNKNWDIDESLISENYRFYATYGYRSINPMYVYKSIKCQYNNDNNESESKKMVKKEYEDIYAGAISWHYYIDEEDVSDLNNLAIRVIVEDNLGNTAYKDFTFPGKNILAGDEIVDEDTRYLTQYPESVNTINPVLVVFKNGTDWKAIWKSNNTIDIDIEYIPDETEFYLLSTNTDALTAQLNEKYIAGSPTSGNHPIEYDKISYENAEKGTTLINVKIKDSSLNYFDTIFAKYSQKNKTANWYEASFLSKGENNIKIKFYTESLFKHDYQVILYGIKDGVCSQSESISIPKFTDPKYDNVCPTLGPFEPESPRYPDCYVLRAEDSQTGISRIVINDKVFKIPSTPDNHPYAYQLNLKSDNNSVDLIQLEDATAGTTNNGVILIKYSDIIDESLGVPLINFEYTMYDKANNATTIKVNKIINQGQPIPKPTKTGSKWNIVMPNNFFGASYFYNNKWNYHWYRSGVSSEAHDLPDNAFIRLYGKYSIPKYYYLNAMNSTNSSWIAEKSSSSNIQVSSDAPVLVQTIVSPRSYSVCKDWTKEEWLFFKPIIGEQVFNLNSSNTTADYTIPLNEIKSGECYVVIAHFADGTSIMSDVMIKQ